MIVFKIQMLVSFTLMNLCTPRRFLSNRVLIVTSTYVPYAGLSILGYLYLETLNLAIVHESQ